MGPYEVLSWLGAGGMGEVYRARDTKLSREVALKTLPEEFARQPDRLTRLRQEARILASLNHPGIATLHGLEEADGGVPVLVMELVEGETLGDRLRRGPLPPREALGVAQQMALALEAAHQKGVLHRDLKPGNIRISPEGRVKLLDFGLAKAVRGAVLDSRLDTHTSPPNEAGAVLGTAPYMSPEQARGQEVDRRSDVWSFGCVLFEMLAGTRAFEGATFSDAVAAVLDREPDWTKLPAETPPAVRRLLRRCLQKEKDQRLRDIGDARLDLEEVSAGPPDPESFGTGTAETPSGTGRGFRVALGLALLALPVLGFLMGGRAADRPVPSFSRLTFRRGVVESARFTADGRTVVYGAAWDGDPVRTFSTRIERPESTRLDLPDAQVEAVGAGEMLISLDRRLGFERVGTLARVPLSGGAPRPIAENVVGADWGPDGSLAIVRRVGERFRLEYPAGQVLYESEDRLWPPRISPAGDLVALYSREPGSSLAVTVFDRAGSKTVLSKGWKWNARYLAWSPKGDEVWFTASEGGFVHPLRAVSLSGKERVLLRLPGTAYLQDVAADGRVLLSSGSLRVTARCLPPGESRERDISWFEATRVRDISADGKTVLLGEFGATTGAGPEPAIYVRKLDGSPPIRLGEGSPQFLSPDGRSVVSWNYLMTELQVIPTGPGDPKRLGLEGHRITGVFWYPDNRRLLVALRASAGEKGRCYSLDVGTGKREPVTPEGVGCIEGLVSPDGKVLSFADEERRQYLLSLADGKMRPVETLGMDPVLGWGADSRSLLVLSRQLPNARVDQFDIATGQRQLFREFSLPDTTGVTLIDADVHIAPNGSYCMTYMQSQADLYLVEGIADERGESGVGW